MQNHDIDKIASLAKLRPDPAERAELLRDIAQIVEYIGNISSIDSSGIEPMRHPPYPYVPPREDVAAAACEPGMLQQGAPETKDGYYLVPRVIE